MRRLIEGDIRRIFLKKSFYILFILSLLYAVGTTVKDMNLRVSSGYAVFNSYRMSSGIFFFLFGLVVFMGVYADEFTSLAMDGVIGRGISRGKYVLAKFLDSLIILFFLFFFYTLPTYIVGAVMSGGLSGDENKIFWLTMLSSVFNGLFNVTMAAMFLYISSGVPLGVFVYIGFSVIVPLAVELIKMKVIEQRYHFTRYYFTEVLYGIESNILFGRYFEAFGTIFLAILVYIVCPLLICSLVFSKKELEF